MINEHIEGNEYNPIPIYNRKLMRTVLRSYVEKKSGYHNVSKQMSRAFHKMRNETPEEESNPS